MEGLAAKIIPLKLCLKIKRLSLQSSRSSAECMRCIWLSGSQTYLTGHFSSWKRHQLLLCPFFFFSFLILLPLHPPPLKRIIYNSVITLFHLPFISFVSVKTPPIFRVICFHLFCLLSPPPVSFCSCESIPHQRVLAAIIFCDFTQRKEWLSKQVDVMPLISFVNILVRFCLVHD